MRKRIAYIVVIIVTVSAISFSLYRYYNREDFQSKEADLLSQGSITLDKVFTKLAYNHRALSSTEESFLENYINIFYPRSDQLSSDNQEVVATIYSIQQGYEHYKNSLIKKDTNGQIEYMNNIKKDLDHLEKWIKE